MMAETAPERVFGRLAEVVNARDWDGVADCYTEDYESIDLRPFGWEPMKGREAVVEFFRSWIEVLPDVVLRFETLVAGDDCHAVLRGIGCGHVPEGGGPIEADVLLVATIRDGRIAREERFDVSDEETALACFRDLMKS